MLHLFCRALLFLLLVSSPPASGGSGWIPLFNGLDLNDWTPKIRGFVAGTDPQGTFHVQEGLLTVSYKNYPTFNNRFGHLFYKTPYSHYRLRLEYRFVGSQAPGGEPWAFKNSGVMVHSQPPGTMLPEQDFPIAIEVQFLGGAEPGKPRPTANVCTPGTHVVYQDTFTTSHCIPSDAPTFYNEDWVSVEIEVQGGRQITHFVNNESVMTYGGLTTGGGVVSGHRPELKPEGKALEHGYIALQSESHPIQFRNIELLPLSPHPP